MNCKTALDLAMQDGRTQEKSHLMLAGRESSKLLYLCGVCVCHRVLGLTLGQY